MPRRSNRHKGERPFDRAQFYRPFDASHPVANAIASGSAWFNAWQFQYGLPDVRLVKHTGLSPTRIRQLGQGAPIRLAEVEALASAYGVQPSDIIASLPDPALLVEE
jgi:DNA-binding Xre family transcriptional regulator